MLGKSILLAGILVLSPLLEAQSIAAQKVREGRMRPEGSESLTPELSVEARAIALGWNFFHVAFCYVDANGVFQIQTTEGPVVFTTFSLDVVMLSPSCQTGNLLAVYVTQVVGDNFDWNGIVTYPFQ